MMPSFIERLGEKLKHNCPDNDCVIFKNIYVAYQEIEEDLNNVKSTYSKLALRKKRCELSMKLADMYYNNYAIKKYKEANE